MTDLGFECVDVTGESYGVAPTLLFRVRVTSAERVHAIALRCQIRIEPAKRRYTDHEAALVADIFGARERWGDTLKPMQFAHTSVMVPSFDDQVEVVLPVPISYDLEVASGKLLHALQGDPLAMTLMFSGTVFGKGERGFWVEQVPWHAEARCELPPSVWSTLMDQYFPDEGWLRLRRAVIDDLIRFKAARGLATWDETIRALLAAGDGSVVSGGALAPGGAVVSEVAL